MIKVEENMYLLWRQILY